MPALTSVYSVYIRALNKYPQISSASQNEHNIELKVTVSVTASNFGALIGTAGVFEPQADSASSQSTLQFINEQMV